MTWGHPDLMWLWLALAPLAAWLTWAGRRRRRAMEQLADAALLPVLVPTPGPGWMGRAGWFAVAAALVVGALARPQWGMSWQEVKRRGLDIMVVLDTSNSMRAEDLKPNRLTRAKWGLRDLVPKLKGDRIGLVAFAGGSFLQCPLTVDYPAFLMTLDDIYAGIIPRGGTSISEGLDKAIGALQDTTEADRAIVLITDGEDHERNPMDLLDTLKKKNIRVFAVGVGTPDGELIPAGDDTPGYLKDSEGKVVKTALGETVLKQLAVGTGGAYVRATPSAFGLDQVYDQVIARMKRSEQEARVVAVREERFAWFIGAALLALAAETVAASSRRRRNSGGGVA